MSLSTNTDGIINAVLGGLQGPAGPAGPAGPPGVSTGQVLFPFPTATGGPNPAPNDGAINLTISNTSESTINTTFTQNVPVRIGSFTTAANYPNVITLLPDLWDLNVYATASAATGVYAFFNLYEVQTDNGNLEVLIAGLNTSPYTGGGVLISGTPSSSVQFYSYSLNVPTYAMYSANSLLRVKLYAVDTLASGRTATFYFGSTSASPYPTHIHSGLVAQGSGGVTINNPAQYRILTDTNASTINGEANLTFNGSTLSVAGGSTTVTSLQATGNSYLATAGGYVGIGNTNTTYNLDVTGTARVSGNTLVGGTLGVTGATTLAGLSAGSTSVSTLSTSGLATLASASVTGNETVGGTLGVSGATTLSGTVNLSSSIPSVTASKYLVLDSGNQVGTISSLPAPTINTLQNFCVAAGGNGTNKLAYSYDGISWTPTGSGIFSANGTGVAFNGNLWFALGNGSANKAAYSVDGINWTGLGTSILTGSCYAAAWNGVLWVVVGNASTSTGPQISYSYDAKNWIQVTNNIFGTSGYGTGVCWNGTQFIATGGNTNNQIAYSYDGINWTGLGNSFFGSGNAGQAVAYNGFLNVVIGGSGTSPIVYSANGFQWNSTSGDNFNGGGGNGIAWNGIRWVAVGNVGGASGYAITTSTDGINWTKVTGSLSIFSGVGQSIAWNGTYWVAGGNGGNTLAYSLDGLTWTPNGSSIFTTQCPGIASRLTLPNVGATVIPPKPNLSPYFTVAGGNGGNNTLAYSYNGTTWIGLGKSIFTSAGIAVAYNGTLWIAAGQGTTNTLAYSYDGINWTGLGKSIFTSAGRSIAWNGTYWVAAGNGGSSIAYSTDGINWTAVTNSTTIFTYGYAIAWNGSIWVAGGSSGSSIAYATDPTTVGGSGWVAVSSSPFSNYAFAIAWNGTQFIAAGGNANSGGYNIAYSYDGINWTGVSNTGFNYSASAIAWNGSLWVAGANGPNYLAYSYDGINWTPTGSGIINTSVQGLSWNGKYWIANLSSGTYSLAYSLDGITWTLGSSVFGPAGSNASASRNLLPVSNAKNLALTGTPATLTGTISAGVPYIIQTVTTTYSPTVVNTYYVLTSSSGATVTLPSASSYPYGSFMTFRVLSNTTTINSVSVSANTTITFINIAGTWTQF